jgi:hypothetical protein
MHWPKGPWEQCVGCGGWSPALVDGRCYRCTRPHRQIRVTTSSKALPDDDRTTIRLAASSKPLTD